MPPTFYVFALGKGISAFVITPSVTYKYITWGILIFSTQLHNNLAIIFSTNRLCFLCDQSEV